MSLACLTSPQACRADGFPSSPCGFPTQLGWSTATGKGSGSADITSHLLAQKISCCELEVRNIIAVPI